MSVQNKLPMDIDDRPQGRKGIEEMLKRLDDVSEEQMFGEHPERTSA